MENKRIREVIDIGRTYRDEKKFQHIICKIQEVILNGHTEGLHMF